MSLRNSLIIILAFFCFCSEQVWALYSDTGMGARASGMGNVFTGVANDSYALYYNPAGLGVVRNMGMGSTYSKYYSGMTDGTEIFEADLSIVIPDNKSGFGFYWQETGLRDYYSEDTLAVGYGFRPFNTLAAGFAVKMRSIGYALNDLTNFNNVFSVKGKSALSLDAGLLYGVMPGVNAGLVVQDILQPNLGLLDDSIVPMTIRAGIAWYPIVKARADLLICVDGSIANGKMIFSAGAEGWVISKTACVRAGYTTGSEGLSQVSGGAGYKFAHILPGTSLQLDYAFEMSLSYSDLGPNHRFSVNVLFDPPPAVIKQ